MTERHGYAGATGEHTRTNVRRDEGGGVHATSYASSTGGGGPQQHEASILHSTTAGPTPDFEHMKTHDLKVWLQARGADLTGAIERSDLLEIARTVPQGGGGPSEALGGAGTGAAS